MLHPGYCTYDLFLCFCLLALKYSKKQHGIRGGLQATSFRQQWVNSHSPLNRMLFEPDFLQARKRNKLLMVWVSLLARHTTGYTLFRTGSDPV